MKCKKCGKEMAKSEKLCPSCGTKNTNPFYKKWWFWVIVVIVVMSIGMFGEDDETTVTNSESEQNQTQEIIYETVDLQTMFDELDNNAMKAEATYQKKNIEFECKIRSFDSDGSYISVEPVGASEWNFATAMCYIKSEAQKDILIQKNVGDIIKIKGKVKSIGEVLGYSIDINEVQ